MWEIDTASPADRPARPQARADAPPLVISEPVVFTHDSHARWHGRTLLQLNYVIWFPERPRQGTLRASAGWEEPISVPQTVPDGSGRLVLRVASTTHYLQRIRRDDAPSDRIYELADYDPLRSLPLDGGGRRSLFGPQGIVPGTRRPERWLFRPMGVPAPCGNGATTPLPSWDGGTSTIRTCWKPTPRLRGRAGARATPARVFDHARVPSGTSPPRADRG